MANAGIELLVGSKVPRWDALRDSRTSSLVAGVFPILEMLGCARFTVTLTGTERRSIIPTRQTSSPLMPMVAGGGL